MVTTTGRRAMRLEKTVRLSIVLAFLLLAGCGGSDATTEPADLPEPTVAPEVDVPPEADILLNADGSGDYAGLAEAVAAASPGDVILLGEGTFRLDGSLEIAQPLRLLGAGMDLTEVVSEAPEYAVLFSGDGLFAAEGISFRHAGDAVADVLLIAGGELDLARCRFAGAVRAEGEDRAGLRIQGDVSGSVRECEALENGNTGILVEGQASPTLADNVCADNAIVGIGILDQAEPALEGNRCSGNVAGIAYRDDAGGVARSNDCSENRWGIFVTDGAEPTLEENTCSSNEDSGIVYYGGAGTARRNTCRGNVVGIGVAGQARPTLEENTCLDNETAGISYLENGGGVARANECSGSLVGIFVEEQAVPELVENDCHDNTQNEIMDLRP
jgi:parallel beta-helix repeat protein